MSEFIIKTPSADANCTQSITASIDDEYITLSDTEFGSQYITIPLDKWQELKDAIDNSSFKKEKSELTIQEQVKADPEFAKQMVFSGLEFFYAQYHSVQIGYTEYDEYKYWLALVSHKPYSTSEMFFNTPDALRDELFKLKLVDTDDSFGVDFDEVFNKFMTGVNDTKQFYGID